MFTGTVKFYNEAKGFGFIVDDETQGDVFVHATGLVDKVAQNDKVTYDIKDGKKDLTPSTSKEPNPFARKL
jgi:CspA family cold shock protein